ncbi:MAG: hypothetical protein A2041_12300 [Bacteroidetes bacterium GWA2_31_9b]|nr:MAG: hypothetical protein A2041_12300 [Bacteroidetes bacterium GWA2_31_9b]
MKSEIALFSGTDTTISNPKVDVKVNKQYDENGNIIRYDSSYTYIYTYPDGRSEYLNMDSVYDQFKPYFFDRGFDMMQRPFNDFFELDSNMNHQFFDEDYFMKQFEQEMFRFDDLMHEMDSLRNLFLKEMYPNIEIEKKPVNIKSNDPIEI